MTDSERLLTVMDYLGYRNNQSAFARAIGYSADNVNKILRNKGKISKKFAEAVTTKFQEISESFLLLGKDEMLYDKSGRSLSDKVIEAEINYIIEDAFKEKDKIIEQQREIINDLKSELKQARELTKVKEDIIVQKVRDAINNQDFQNEFAEAIKDKLLKMG